jgi:transposase-like protein
LIRRSSRSGCSRGRRSRAWAWSGLGGLLNQLTENVLEVALEAELTEHLGHEHGGVPMAVIVVKVWDGQVRNTPFYVVMGVTSAGEREILGIWAGDGAEGARFWLQVFSELKNRGVEDVLIAVCDGLKGLPEAITTTWEHTIVQQCVVHLIRNSFRYVGRQHATGSSERSNPFTRHRPSRLRRTGSRSSPPSGAGAIQRS